MKWANKSKHGLSILTHWWLVSMLRFPKLFICHNKLAFFYLLIITWYKVFNHARLRIALVLQSIRPISHFCRQTTVSILSKPPARNITYQRTKIRLQWLLAKSVLWSEMQWRKIGFVKLIILLKRSQLLVDKILLYNIVPVLFISFSCRKPLRRITRIAHLPYTGYHQLLGSLVIWINAWQWG